MATSRTDGPTVPNVRLSGTDISFSGGEGEASYYGMTQNLLLTEALACAPRGWRVLPLHGIVGGACTCGEAECSSPGKHPRILEWQRGATCDERIIRSWWAKWPQANVGIMTGAESGFVVLDVDPRHGGDEALRDLEQTHGALPATPVSLTGGGGAHYLFEHPGEELRNKTELLQRPGVDFRGDGGFVVAPGSRHASGRQYLWEASAHPDDMPLAPLPPWLLDALTQATRKVAAAELPDRIGEGGRNAALASLAGSMRRRGASSIAIHAALTAENEERCDPPLSGGEVQQIAESVARYKPADVRERLSAVVAEDEEAWAALGAPAAEPATNGASPEPAAPWQPISLPDDHYVRRYTRYAQSRTDAPPEYHEALAVLQLSAAVGRGVRIPLASKPDGMRCNLLILLLGDSTLFRKSTSQDLATDLLRVVDDGMFLANDQSPQGFVQEMAMRDGGTSLWHRDEFRSFLAQLQKAGWMAGGKELLMKLFDSSAYHRRLRTKMVKGEAIADEEYVREPYLVVIAAGVTSRIIDVLTVDDVVDGFIPRFLTVAPKTLPPRRPASTITAEIEAERRGLIGTLRNIYSGFKEKGECSVQFDDAVLDRWNEYAARIEAEAAASANADTWGPIAGRIADYALKIATLLQAADGAPANGSNLHLSMNMLEAAIELCERLRKDAEELAMEIGSSAGERKLRRFVQMVLQHPGIARREVARALHVDKRDFDNLEATAVDREFITCANKNTRGRPAKCYYPHQA